MTDAVSSALVSPAGGRWLDRAGISASVLCATHCLALPLLVALIPVAGLELVLGDGLEWAFVIVSIVLGGLSLVPGFLRVHRRLLPIVLLFLGASLLLAARTMVGEGNPVEVPVVATGALSMILAHGTNLHFCRACRSCASSSS